MTPFENRRRPDEEPSSLVEVAVMTGFILSYVWVWQRAFKLDSVVSALLAVGLAVWAHRRQGESARDLGFRLDNLPAAAALVSAWVVPLLAVLVALGLLFDLDRELPIPGLGARILVTPVFGILQQYLLLGFYYRRAERAFPGRWRPVLLTASLFTLLHAPNLPLMLMSLGVGLGACWLYRRAANLWVLGLAHGLISVTVAVFLSRPLTLGMKVGLRALG